MSALFDHPATLALASTLLQFLWQGAILGLAAFAILRYARLSADTRYVVGVITLAAMLAAPAVTFGVTYSRATATRTAITEAAASPVGQDTRSLDAVAMSVVSDVTPSRPVSDHVQIAESGAGDRAVVLSATLRTILLTLWFTGVLVLSLRLLGGWIVARRLAIKAIRPVAPEVQSLATRVAGRLALDRVVRVVESSAVTVPAMIGWMKPVVLLPAAALAGLSPAQLEALIAHELAHVRRHDYLVNLLQTIVETLLFYHPAVWWVSRQVRRDREHCCDDLAVGVCDRLTYVTALANLAAMSTRPRLALAATDGSLIDRVRRILGQPSDNVHGSGWLATVMIVTLAGGAIASTAIARPSPPSQPANPTAMAAQGATEVPQQATSSPVAQESPAAVQRPEAATAARAEAETARLAALLAEQQSADQQRTREARELAFERLLQEDAQKHERLLEMQRQLDRERLAVEKRAREIQSNIRISAIEAELKAAHEALDRAKQQFEVGVVDRSVISKLEMDLKNAESQLMAARAERQMLEADIELRLREAELRRQSERRAAELDRAMREAMGEPGAQYQELARKLQELEELLAKRTESRYAIAERMTAEPVANPNEPVRVGDLLVIEIAGEPDLPREYEVRSDGTIRLPLIGSVRVAGSTASQVRDAVARQITDRGLGKSPGVAVSLRRPRGE
jgi:beta-lactamase regulating signal transducer with metallopeptidase domain